MIEVHLEGGGKAGDTIVLDSGPLNVNFVGKKLVVGGAAGRVRQLYIVNSVARYAVMPPSPDGIPTQVFAFSAVGSEMEMPLCRAGESFKLEVTLDVDGQLQAKVLGEAP